MKNILTILLVSCLFCNACTNLPGLKRKSAQNLYQTVQEGEGRYYNAEDGHNQNVKMIFDKENGTVQIKIPVNYQENVQAIPKKIPEALAERIKDINFDNLSLPTCEIGREGTLGLIPSETNKCTLNNKELTIELRVNWTNIPTCIGGSIFLTPFSPFVLLGCLSDENGKCGFLELYRDLCSSYIDTNDPIIRFVPSKDFQLYFDRLREEYKLKGNVEDLGLDFGLNVSPTIFRLECDKKSCQVVDEKGKIVNNIYIKKTISVNQKKINQLLQQEAEKKRQDEIKWQRLKRQQTKECPGLYQTLYLAQQGYYLDPLVGMKTAKRFEELQCGIWLQRELRGLN